MTTFEHTGCSIGNSGPDARPDAGPFSAEWNAAVKAALLIAIQDGVSNDCYGRIQALRRPEGAAPAKACRCEACAPLTEADMRMILCAICGNKRCPHATDHRNACTNSNATGQVGSSYAGTAPVAPPAAIMTTPQDAMIGGAGMYQATPEGLNHIPAEFGIERTVTLTRTLESTGFCLGTITASVTNQEYRDIFKIAMYSPAPVAPVDEQANVLRDALQKISEFTSGYDDVAGIVNKIARAALAPEAT
jgi:hypothetical protein